MNYFFYNTDSRAIIDKPRPRFGVLIDRKLAAVGGDRKKFGEQLGKLSPDDVLLMYENLVGIVAVGRVLERWDEVTHSDSLYYSKHEMKLLTGGAFEYRIAVDWFIDLSHSPFSVQQLRELLGYTPRGTIKKIVEHRAKIEKFISEIDNSNIHESNCLPTKEEFESAYRALIRPGGTIAIDAVLDQIERCAREKGLLLKSNWRMITEKNIEIWSKNG
jgi:hypothetical protein